MALLPDLGVEQNLAPGAFLKLLEWLREMLLQDAVFLRESYPNHPIFQDPVFSCTEFEAFAGKVRESCRQAQQDSHTTAIQKAIPVVAEQLRTVLAQQSAAGQLAERHMDLYMCWRTLTQRWTSFYGRPTPSLSALAHALVQLINRGAVWQINLFVDPTKKILWTYPAEGNRRWA